MIYKFESHADLLYTEACQAFEGLKDTNAFIRILYGIRFEKCYDTGEITYTLRYAFEVVEQKGGTEYYMFNTGRVGCWLNEIGYDVFLKIDTCLVLSFPSFTKISYKSFDTEVTFLALDTIACIEHKMAKHQLDGVLDLGILTSRVSTIEIPYNINKDSNDFKN